MAPLHSYYNWNKRSNDQKEQIEPYRKYFIIAEGVNTERWYFEEIIDKRKLLGIHPLIDVRYLERTEEDQGSTHPVKLLELAEKYRSQKEFVSQIDQMIVIFDADIFEREDARATGLSEIISQGSVNNILGITNPSFELFLLLHFRGSYEAVIQGNETDIIANRKNNKHRYINDLLQQYFKFNVKKNEAVKELIENLDIAIEQEKKVNQDIFDIHGKVTSNIGLIMASILADNPDP